MEFSTQTAKWYKLCLIKNKSEFVIVWDGIIQHRIHSTVELFPVDGFLVVGRKRMDDNNELNAFIGKVSNIRAYISKEYITINDTEIHCSSIKERLHGLVIDMTYFKYYIEGSNIRFYDFNPCSLISDKQRSNIFVWPVPVQYIWGIRTCMLLDYNLLLIDDETANAETSLVLKNSPGECLGLLSSYNVGWIQNRIPEAYYQNLTYTDSFKPDDYFVVNNQIARESDLTDKSETITIYAPLLVANGEWKLESQTDLACPICKGSEFHQSFRLRGICQDPDQSITFYPRLEESDTGQLYFHGNIDILLVFTSTGWILKNFSSSGAIAMLSSKKNPIGRNDWNIYYMVQSCKTLDTRFPTRRAVENQEGVEMINSKYSELIFSSCSKDQFVCKNGDCVPKEKRCSRYAECFDGSDELKCDLLNTNVESMKYYNSAVPPNRKILMMQVNATLQKVRFAQLTNCNVESLKTVI